MNPVNYTFAITPSGQAVVLPDAEMYGGISKVDFNTWKKTAQGIGWNPYGTNIYDPTITNPDQARAKYGSGSGSYIAQGQSTYDRLLSAGGDVAKAIRAAETGGSPVSAGAMVDGKYTTNEALAQQQANEAAVKAGTMKVAQVVNGVPIYVSTTPAETRTPQTGTGVVQQGTQGQPAQTTPAPTTTQTTQGTTQTTPTPGQVTASTTAPGMVAQYNQQTGQYQMVQSPEGRNIPTNISPTGYDFGGKHYALNPSTGRFEEAVAQPNTASYGPVTSSPASQTISGVTTDSSTALQRVIDMYTATSKALGIPNIKEQIDKVIQDQKDLAQAKQNEINNINNNPWLSQDIRNRELNKIDANYQSREETYSNLAKLYDSMYQQAQAQVKSIVAQTQDDISKAMELAQKQQEAVDKLKQNYTFQTLNGRDVLVDKTTGKIVVDYGPAKTGTSAGTAEERKANLVSMYEQRMSTMTKFPDGVPLYDSNGYLTKVAFQRLISSAVQDGMTRETFLKQLGSRIYTEKYKDYGITPAELKFLGTE